MAAFLGAVSQFLHGAFVANDSIATCAAAATAAPAGAAAGIVDASDVASKGNQPEDRDPRLHSMLCYRFG